MWYWSMMLKNILEPVQSDKSWTIKETSDDVAMYSLSSSGCDS